MNAEVKKKLLCLADWIETLPEQKFDMGQWSSSVGEVHLDPEDSTKTLNQYGSECATACCIAGWVVLAKGHTVKGVSVLTESYFSTDLVPLKAREILGLTPEETEALFYPGNWPGCAETNDPYTKFPNTPKGAADRIRHFVQTGE